MFLLRWIVGMPVAAMITAGLFLMMAQMIRDRNEPLPDPEPDRIIKITRDLPPEGGPQPEPPSKTLPKDIPETPIDFPKTTKAPTGPVEVPTRTTTPTSPPGPQGVAGPVVRTRPFYPEACRSRGVEGNVIVEFDVTPEGNVVNPRIVQTPNRCFNRTVIKAVSGWKYPPASGGGMRFGIIERFSFQLEE